MNLLLPFILQNTIVLYQYIITLFIIHITPLNNYLADELSVRLSLAVLLLSVKHVKFSAVTSRSVAKLAVTPGRYAGGGDANMSSFGGVYGPQNWNFVWIIVPSLQGVLRHETLTIFSTSS